MKRAVLALTVILGLLAPSLAFPGANPRNIVLFVADDHGLDAGCYGNSVIRTPHLDQLAREGTVYLRAFCTTASCSASRSVLLTGLQNHATGHFGHAHAFHHFSTYASVQSLPVLLARQGYHTARIGKFHLAPEEVYRFQTVLRGNARSPVEMAEKCRGFLATNTTPFFLYFCGADPHRGGGPRKELPHQPDGFGNGPQYPGVQEVVYDPQKIAVPAYLPDTPACRAELAQYYQSVSRLDQGLGRLITVLKETGHYDHTLIVYLSDNGPAFPGAKTTLYDPGMRLPLVVRSPHATKRGLRSQAMVSWADLTPTLLDFAGIKEVVAPPRQEGDPEERPPLSARSPPDQPYSFHGRSFLPTLEAENPPGWNGVFASHQFHEITMYYPMRVLRTDRYKLILNLAHPLPYPFASDLYESATWQDALRQGPDFRFGKRLLRDYVQRPRFELYDLEQDPEELHNVAADARHQVTFTELSRRLHEWQTLTRDPWRSKYDYE